MKNKARYRAETNPLLRRGQGEANIVIIKYNAGNIESVNNALNRLGVNAEIK
jgi:hypothetical protein